jgi:hypothetical protein
MKCHFHTPKKQRTRTYLFCRGRVRAAGDAGLHLLLADKAVPHHPGNERSVRDISICVVIVIGEALG